jgi:hypothetical protein
MSSPHRLSQARTQQMMGEIEKPHRLVESQSLEGNPVRVGESSLIPVVRSVRVHLPLLRGFLRWDRPESVVMVSPDGSKQKVTIRDDTRIQQVALLGIGLIGTWMIWRLKRGFS